MNDVELLKYIHGINRYGGVDIKPFLKEQKPELDTQAVKTILKRLFHSEKISVEDNAHHWLLLEKAFPGQPKVLKTLDNTDLIVSLTENGRQDVDNMQLREDVRSVNDSVKETNKSTIKLNDIVLPQSFSYQRKFGNRSMLLALVSLIFIGLTFWQQYRDKTESRLQELSLKSDSLRIELQNLRSSLEELNSSIQRITTDTFVVKKRH